MNPIDNFSDMKQLETCKAQQHMQSCSHAYYVTPVKVFKNCMNLAFRTSGNPLCASQKSLLEDS